MNEKAIYTQKAPLKMGEGAKLGIFILITLALILVLMIANALPYSGILTIVVLALGAYAIYKYMCAAVFDITYTLYKDKLVFVRKYGKMEWECEVFPFDEAKFSEGSISHRGKSYKFYPDNKLKELLGV
ncbi:MAG: hypothetical protein IJ297_07950 [Clostridia bacterium]|nr:hypothetical protein [Clostridia bacterium]